MPALIAINKAVLRLSDAIQQAIRDITGEEPEWCTVKPGHYPGG
jgi:hypothetical protein